MQIHVNTKDKVDICIFTLFTFLVNSLIPSLYIKNYDVWTIFSIVIFAIFVVCRNYFKQKWFIVGIAIIIVLQMLIFIVFGIELEEFLPYGFVSLGTIYAVIMGGILEVSRKIFGR